jgi:hypothetical protein
MFTKKYSETINYGDSNNLGGAYTVGIGSESLVEFLDKFMKIGNTFTIYRIKDDM